MEKHLKKLEQANQAIQENQSNVEKGIYRQNYHFCPPVGWLNDPNGLIQFQDEYHMFYQFNPFQPHWAQMHWGHAKSKDMIHWEHLPVALAPSESYDDEMDGGCFSGTSIEKDGVLYLFYTGVAKENGKHIQTQNVAYSEDGIHFVKHTRNPIIELDYPGTTPDMFRDPKVWEANGIYHMIIGASIQKKGNVLYYQSKDLIDWDLIGPLVDYEEDLGFMWECPDIFELDGKYVLLFSPMGMDGHTTVYFVGEMDYEAGKFIPEQFEKIDAGYDFYAPQTFLDHKNRRIMIGWQNGWEWMPGWKGFGPNAEADGWCGSMSIPRVVHLQDNKLSFQPIEELSDYTKEKHRDENVQVNADGYTLPLVKESFLLTVNTQKLSENITIRVKNEEGEEDLILLGKDRLTYDTKNNPDGKPKKEIPFENDQINIYYDSCSVEIFGENSGKVFSVNSYLKKGNRHIEISSDVQTSIPEIALYEIVVQ